MCFHAKFLCCFLATVNHYHIEFSLLLSITALASLPSKRVFKTSLFRTGIASFPLHFDAFLAMLVCVYMCVCVCLFFIDIVYAFAHNPMSECARDHVCVSLRFVEICEQFLFVCLFIYH